MSDPLAPSCERCGSRKVLDDAYECAPCWERTTNELDDELDERERARLGARATNGRQS